jgi:CHAT domain-containing protein/Tfp pilus assembly protein PilF
MKFDRGIATIKKPRHNFFYVILPGKYQEKVSICFSFILFFMLFSGFSYVTSRNTSYEHDIESVIKSGKKLLQKGEFEQSINTFKQGLELTIKTDDKRKQFDCLWNLGLLFWNTGRMKGSAEFYTRALSTADKLNLRDEKQECIKLLEIYQLYTEGRDYRNQGQFDKSIGSFEKAIFLSREIKSMAHELKCLQGLSIIHLVNSDFENFISLSEKALKISRTLNHKREIKRALTNIGTYNVKKSKYSQALSNFIEALDIARRLDNKDDISSCLNNLANIYFYFGSFQKSIDIISEALMLDKEIGNNIYISMDFNDLGVAYRRKALITEDKIDYYKALKNFRECLDLAQNTGDRKTEVMALNNIGNVYLDMKQPSKAFKYFQTGMKKIKDIADFKSSAALLSNTGFVHLSLGDFIKAENSFRSAYKLSQNIEDNSMLWKLYFGLGQICEMQKKFDLAIFNYKNAIKIIDYVRRRIALDVDKVGYIQHKFEIYERLINLYFAVHSEDTTKGMETEMFITAEKAKARAFLDILEQSKIDIRKQLSPELIQQEREISERIARYIKELSSAEIRKKEREEIEKNLLQEENRYYALISRMRLENPKIMEMVSPKYCSPEQIQEQYLDDKTALVEYFLGEERSYLFIISKDTFKMFPLPSRSKMINSVKGYLKILAEPPTVKFRGEQAARRLYSELISQAEKCLPHSVTNLVIIPDGILYYLPFETLIMSDNEKSSGNNYLISKYTISYVPSVTSLLFLMQSREDHHYKKDLLAFGDPIYLTKPESDTRTGKTSAEVLIELYKSQGYNFSPIPYSAREVKMIASLFPKNRTDVYLKNGANEHAFKKIPLEDYRVIHFACHSFLDERFPLRSALVLSLENDTQEDGFLNVREMYNFRLNADLVVLSSCQTGRGRMERCEGILGLPRIFFYTGSHSVVSTLWKVEDESTARFMEIFYEYLSQGESKTQAIRLAKLKMIKTKFAHPFYWGAFILNGEYNSAIFLS